MEKCCGGSVVVVGKCCEGVLWRSVIEKCWREVLENIVVEKCWRTLL